MGFKSVKTRNTIFLCSVVLFAASLMAAGCSASQGTSIEISKNSAQVYELEAHFWLVPSSNTAVAINRGLDLVEERSGGRLKFNRTWSGEVVTMDGAIDAINQDITDVTYIYQGIINARTPLSSIVCTPGYIEKLWPGMMAWIEFYHQDAILSEWTRYNAVPVWPAPGPPATIISKNEIPSYSDVKGSRFFAVGMTAQVIQNIGGFSSSISTPNAYHAFSRGVFDATWYPAVYVPQYRWYEILKYWYPNTNIGSLVQVIAFNNRTLNRLPDDLRNVITDAGPDIAALLYEEVILNTLPEINRLFLENGVQSRYWSDSDIAKLNEIGVKPLMKTRMRELEDAGFTDVEYYINQWLDLYSKYEALLPVEAEKRGWEETPD